MLNVFIVIWWQWCALSDCPVDMACAYLVKWSVIIKMLSSYPFDRSKHKESMQVSSMSANDVLFTSGCISSNATTRFGFYVR